MKKTPFLSAFLILGINSMAQNYYVSTVAGIGTQGLVDGSAVMTAQLNWPYGVAYDGDSIIYFSDAQNHVIRKVNIVKSIVMTIAGNGTPGFQDGAGASARFNWPDDVFYKNGVLYVADRSNNRIRQIDLSNNMVTSIAGTGTAGHQDGLVGQAMFNGGNGLGLEVDKNGDIYVADGGCACVRKISNGSVSTVAGVPGVFGFQNGAANQAQFARPRYLALDTSNGDLYITDINNNRIRKLSNGVVTTFSGTGAAGGIDGPANTATFSAPVGIARTKSGYFYVIDGGGNKLREIDPTGAVTTVAGNGVFGFQDGPAASAEFNYPQDVCYDKCGFIYLADRNNNRIRKISIWDIDCGVGVSDIHDLTPAVSLYPNPSAGTLTIKTADVKFHSSYKIYDMTGREVKNGILNSLFTQVDLQEMTDGIYSVVVIQDTEITPAKISLQR